VADRADDAGAEQGTAEHRFLNGETEDPRPEDEHAFVQALTVLGAGQRDWLRAALAGTYGDHPWQRSLEP
jgi:hypothetical protein